MYTTYNLKPDGINQTGVHLHRPIYASNIGVLEVLISNGWYNLPDGGAMVVRTADDGRK